MYHDHVDTKMICKQIIFVIYMIMVQRLSVNRDNNVP